MNDQSGVNAASRAMRLALAAAAMAATATAVIAVSIRTDRGSAVGVAPPTQASTQQLGVVTSSETSMQFAPYAQSLVGGDFKVAVNDQMETDVGIRFGVRLDDPVRDAHLTVQLYRESPSAPAFMSRFEGTAYKELAAPQGSNAICLDQGIADLVVLRTPGTPAVLAQIVVSKGSFANPQDLVPMLEKLIANGPLATAG
jgi:hypothetical protein